MYKIGEVGSGVDYMYLDSSGGSWQMSKYLVNTSQGALGQTLNQLYTRKAYQVRLPPLYIFLWVPEPPETQFQFAKQAFWFLQGTESKAGFLAFNQIFQTLFYVIANSIFFGQSNHSWLSMLTGGWQ